MANVAVPIIAVAASAAATLWALFTGDDDKQKKIKQQERKRQKSRQKNNYTNLLMQKEKIQKQLNEAKKSHELTSQLYQEIKENYSEMEKNYNNLSEQFERIQNQNNQLHSSKIKSQDKMNNLSIKLANLEEHSKKASKELQYYKDLAKKNSDPKLYSQAKQSIFTSFLDNLKTYNFTDVLPKKPNHRYHVVMGMISAGKSSLLKKITGANIKTGMGQTTDKVTLVGQYQNGDQFVNIYDAPGINQQFSCYAIETLALLSGMDQIFVVYSTSLKNVKDLLQIIHTLKPEQIITCIRTQCDRFEKNDQDEATCEQELETDKKYMQKNKIPCRIFAFSSKKDMNFMDNTKVSDLIKGSCK